MFKRNKKEPLNQFASQIKYDLFSHILFYALASLLVIVPFILLIIVSKYIFLLLLLIPALGIFLSIYNDIMISKYFDNKYQLNTKKLTLVRDNKNINVDIMELRLHDIMILKAGDEVPAGLLINKGNLVIDDSLYSNTENYKFKQKDDFLEIGSKIIDGEATCEVVRLMDKYQDQPTLKNKGVAKYINIVFSVLLGTFLLISVILFILGNSAFSNASFDVNKLVLTVLSTGLVAFIPFDYFLFSYLVKNRTFKAGQNNNVLFNNIHTTSSLKECDVYCFDRLGSINDGTYSIKDIVPFSSENSTYIKSAIFRVLNATGANDPVSLSLLNNVTSVNNEKASSYAGLSAKNKYMYALFSDGLFALGNAEDMPLVNKSVILRKISEYSSKGYTVVTLAKGHKNGEDNALNCVGIVVLEPTFKEEFKEIVNSLKINNKNYKIICSDEALYLKDTLKKYGLDNDVSIVSLKGMNDEEVLEIGDKYTIFYNATSYQKEMIVMSLQNKGQKVAYVGGSINSLFAIKTADYSIATSNSHNMVKISSDIALETPKISSINVTAELIEKQTTFISKISSHLLAQSFFGFIAIIALLFTKLICVNESFDVEGIVYIFYLIKIITIYPIITLIFDKNAAKIDNFRVYITNNIVFSVIAISFAAFIPFGFYLFSNLNGVYTGVNSFKLAYNMSILSTLITTLIIGFKYCVPTKQNKYPLIVMILAFLCSAIYILICVLVMGVNKQDYGIISNLSILSGFNYFLIGVSSLIGCTIYYALTYIIDVLFDKNLEKEEDEKDENRA